jgi:hypothetical protein
MPTRLSKRGRAIVGVVAVPGKALFKIGAVAAGVVFIFGICIPWFDRFVMTQSNDAVRTPVNLLPRESAPPPPHPTVFQPAHSFVAAPVAAPLGYLTPTSRPAVTRAPGSTVTTAPQQNHGLVYNQTSGFAPNQKTQKTGFVYPTNFNSGYQGGSRK